jgi:AcrR family transcriptional regulator
MTLEEVARVGEVSKGGLLYHFASKEALVRGMLEVALGAFEKELTRLRGSDRSPGSWLRAYIAASFPADRSITHDQSLIGSAVLASVGSGAELAEPYRAHLRDWARHASDDGLPPATAQAIRLAIDSLWLHEALGLSPYEEQDRARLIEGWVEMTRKAPAATAQPADARRSRSAASGT